jgi:fatty acid desaturase
VNNFFGYIFGNLVLGFSVSWWKTKHNLHHTAPNECDQTYTPIDEDIDTLPLIAWSKEILETVENKRILRVLQYQHYAVVPLLFLARASWLFGSFLFTFNPALGTTKGTIEKVTVLGHYAWFAWAAFNLLPGVIKPIAWMCATELVAGFCLGFVFTLSHNGKEVYNESKDFVNAQILTTRNTKAGWFNDWFTGGLDRQIEHHLFPTMPRHNYPVISPQVEAMCRKHGLEYEDVTVAAASLSVLKALKEIADAATEKRLAAEATATTTN